MPCDEGASCMTCKHDAEQPWPRVCVCVCVGSQSWPCITCSEWPYVAGVLTRSLIALGPNLPLNLPTSHSLRNHEFNIRTLDARSSCVCTSSPLSHKSDIDRGRDACSFLPAITLAQSLNHTRMCVGAHADDCSCTNESQPCCECTHSLITHSHSRLR